MGKAKPATLTAIKGGSKKPTTKSKAKDEVRTRRPQHKSSKAVSKSELKKGSKKRQYSDAELGIPKLNGIIPTGVVKTGGKKGKVFVDDTESLKTIMAMVNAAQEGHIESKLAKARHLEEIREAKRQEAEARTAAKRSKLEDVKDDLRRKRSRKSTGSVAGENRAPQVQKEHTEKANKKPAKRVTFG